MIQHVIESIARKNVRRPQNVGGHRKHFLERCITRSKQTSGKAAPVLTLEEQDLLVIYQL